MLGGSSWGRVGERREIVILMFRVSRRPGFWMSGDSPEWQSAMRVVTRM